MFSFPYCLVSGMPARPEDSAHVTAIYGDWVALNCDVNFPDGHVVPYVVQWWRKVCCRRFLITSIFCLYLIIFRFFSYDLIILFTNTGTRSPNLHMVRQLSISHRKGIC